MNVEAVYWLWLRELIRFWRSRSRLLGSLIQPLLFLVFLGGGLSSVSVGGTGYQQFIFPGVIAMSLITVSVASGMSMIWDKEFGFLKEVLVSPVSRTSVFLGKALGGASSALISATVILLMAPLFGVALTPLLFLQALFVMLLISMGFVSLGLIVASFMDSFEGFGTIMNFVTLPLFFLSGAIFPLSSAPPWLQAISMADPLTYGVNALRGLLLNQSVVPLLTDLSVIAGFLAIMIVLGAWAFNRQD
jgi:ABC-2 type transport system permease protein